MNQRLLRKTIESFYTRTFTSSKDLLAHVVTQIVQHDSIAIQGGRVWRLNATDFTYELITQVGAVQHIQNNFRLKVSEYRLFKMLPEKRTGPAIWLRCVIAGLPTGEKSRERDQRFIWIRPDWFQESIRLRDV